METITIHSGANTFELKRSEASPSNWECIASHGPRNSQHELAVGMTFVKTEPPEWFYLGFLQAIQRGINHA